MKWTRAQLLQDEQNVTFDEDVQRCMDAGMNAHIAKPIDAQLMFETLAVHMQAKK